MTGVALHPAPVPFVRLDAGDAALFEELLDVVADVAQRGAFTLGVEVERFEEEFAAYCGSAAAVGVSSGTDALALTLRALGVGPGDEVIVPANTFIATAEAVSAAGARPVPVDVDPLTHLVTAAQIERALTGRTRCVIPVHLFGAVVEMDPILALARDRGLRVVEDACQAHGARYGDRRVGTLGDAGCFSFYPTKNLGGWGDGGAIVTDDSGLAEHLRLLRSHGERPRYHHRVVGGTCRLDGLQAAVLRTKLRRLDGWNESRRSLASRLSAALEGGPVRVCGAAPGSDHVHHLFVVRSAERERLRDHLAASGVATAVHYPVPVHLTEAYRDLGLGPGDLPVAERLATEICSLPLFPSMSDDELARIAEAVREFVPGGDDDEHLDIA